jgi:hypothetical protein
MPDALVVQDTGPAPAAPEVPVGPDDAAVLAALEGKPAEAAPPPPEAPAKEKTPEPETPKESALVRSIKLREQRLVADRNRMAEEQRRWEQSFEERVQRKVAEATRAALADPRAAVKALGAAGVADQAIADALLHKDGATPQEIALAAQQEIAKLRQERAEEQQQATRARVEGEYLATADKLDAAGKLPHLLLEYERHELVPATHALIAELQQDCQRRGVPVPQVTDERFLQILDKRAKLRQDARQERIKGRGADSTKAAAQADTKAGTNGSGHRGGQTGASATTTLGKGLGERQTMATDDPVLASREDILARVNKAVSEGVSIKAR